jgi:hypothetical protein
VQLNLTLVCVALGAWMLAPAAAYGEPKQIVITWSNPIDTTTLSDSINRLRINADDSVSLKVTHFNFLHYSLKLTIEERTIESYVLLDRLWSQIFKAASVLELTADDGSFDGAIVAWRRTLANSDVRLADFVKKFAGQIALSAEQRDEIGSQKTPLGSTTMATLESMRRDALALAETSQEFDLYERVLAQHKLVVGRAGAFVAAADLIVNGKVFPIGKKKSGTVVSFTLAPMDATEATASDPLTASYFVRSTMPLMLHVGYAASRLNDLDFTTVRSASGADLFLATNDETTHSLVTFMSYEFWRWGPSDDVGLSATLGTSFQKPGEQLFFGGGVRVNRFVLSLGTLGTGVKEGVGGVLESVAGAAGQRELFAAVTTKQSWSGFAAISIRVF